MAYSKKQKQPDRRSKRSVKLIIRSLAVVIFVMLVATFLNGDLRSRVISNVAGYVNGRDSKVVALSTSSRATATPLASGQTPSPVATPTKTTKLTVGPPYSGLPTDVRVKIPRLQIDAPIVPVGLNANGEIDAPPDADSVGWYNLSPVPGSSGNSVLEGHVDWKTRTAVFWELRKIQPGDVIYISATGRADSAFVVEWVERYAPEDAPIDRIFASLYEPALTLITCEGEFNQDTHNYSQRLVVRAKSH